MKKLFTSLMLMLFAVLTVAAQSVVYTLDTSLEENKGTNNAYASNCDVTVNGITWNVTGNATMAPWRIGGKNLTEVDRTVMTTNAYSQALSKVVLTLGDLVSGITVNKVSLTCSDNAEFSGEKTTTIEKDYANEIEFAPESGFAANSYYKFVFNVTVPGTSNKFVTFNKVEFYGEAAGAGWDKQTVTSSLDGVTINSWEALNGITIKFPGANSIVVDEEALFNAGSTWQIADVPGIMAYWSPMYNEMYGTNCAYEVNGDEITFTGWFTEEMIGADAQKTIKKPTAKTIGVAEDETKTQLNVFGGGFIVDGDEDWALGAYGDQLDFYLDYEIAAPAEPFAITVSNYRVEGTNNGRQEASEFGLSTGFQVAAEPALSAGTAVATLSFNGEDQGEATINAYGYPSAGGSIQFNAAPAAEQGMFSAPGEYTLIVPEGTFVDAEGTPSAAFSSTWVIIEKETNPFDITAVTMNWKGEEIAAGSEVEALSYAYNVVTDKEGLVAGEGHIEFKNAEGAGIGVGSWNGYYLSFTNFGQDGYTTPGTYTLTIPAGALVDAEGNPCNEFTATWTVVAPEIQTINIETVEVGTVDKNFDEITDTYYTATVKFQKPEGAAYAYVEGMQVSLNGETSNVMFMAPEGGFVELGAEDEVTLVFTDGMKAATNDPEFDGDLRPAGSYVATAEIYFMDEGYLELPVVAKYTGSIVLPNLNAVEIGEPVFNVEGELTMGDLEANGIVMTLPESKNITPDMTIKVVADFLVSEGTFGPGEDGQHNMPQFVVSLEDVEFTGDAMFGVPSVSMTSFVEEIVQGVAGKMYQIHVKSIEVLSSNGVEASWTETEEALPVGTIIAIVEKFVTENVAAKVGATEPNEYGDQFYTVTLTVPADEIAGLGVAKAYCEGVKFTKYLEDEPWVEEFTFNAIAMDGVEVAEEEDIVFVCKDALPFKTTDATYEGDLRGKETDIEAMAIIVLTDALDNEIGTAEYRGVLTLSEEVATGINTVKFNVTDVKYNLSGQRVDNAKGIVIMNGKKYMTK